MKNINFKEVVKEKNILGSPHRLNFSGYMENGKNILLDPQPLDTLKVPT